MTKPAHSTDRPAAAHQEMSPPFALRRLSPADAAIYRRVRLRALRLEPAAFCSAYQEEVQRPRDDFAARLAPSPDRWTWGAFIDDRLVGIITLFREPRRKERHKASIVALYVERPWRGRGIGAALLSLAEGTAARMHGVRQVRLAVTAANRRALDLYLKNGFAVYGREERALRVGARFYAELFLSRPV